MIKSMLRVLVVSAACGGAISLGQLWSPLWFAGVLAFAFLFAEAERGRAATAGASGMLLAVWSAPELTLAPAYALAWGLYLFGMPRLARPLGAWWLLVAGLGWYVMEALLSGWGHLHLAAVVDAPWWWIRWAGFGGPAAASAVVIVVAATLARVSEHRATWVGSSLVLATSVGAGGLAERVAEREPTELGWTIGLAGVDASNELALQDLRERTELANDRADLVVWPSAAYDPPPPFDVGSHRTRDLPPLSRWAIARQEAPPILLGTRIRERGRTSREAAIVLRRPDRSLAVVDRSVSIDDRPPLEVFTAGQARPSDLALRAAAARRPILYIGAESTGLFDPDGRMHHGEGADLHIVEVEAGGESSPIAILLGVLATLLAGALMRRPAGERSPILRGHA